MKRSAFFSFVLLSSAGAAVYYLFRTAGGQGMRDSIGDQAQRSSQWLTDQRQELTTHLRRIETQIEQLGEEMRQKLDDIAAQAANAVQPSFDVDQPWDLEGGDVQRELPGLPGR